MVDKGLIYKGKKLVYWFFLSEFLLVEVEIEYYDKCLVLIYVVFDVKDDKGVVDVDVKFIIWIIMLWIILLNVVIIVYFELKYG